MTDFYAQLEDQLVTAGRRRQTQGRARRAIAGRGRALVAATAVAAALAAGVAVALPQLRTTSTTSTPAATVAPPGVAPGPLRGGSLAGIRVAVLNGTTGTGLARLVADALGRRHAAIFEVGSAARKNVRGTVVYYRPGARAKARRVAAVLGGVPVRPSGASPDRRVAEVVVIVGVVRPLRPVPPAAVPATPNGPTAVAPAATIPLPAPARPVAPSAATPVPPVPAPSATVPSPAAVPVPPRTTPVAPQAP